jgi:hypothetical protein
VSAQKPLGLMGGLEPPHTSLPDLHDELAQNLGQISMPIWQPKVIHTSDEHETVADRRNLKGLAVDEDRSLGRRPQRNAKLSSA